RGYGRGVRRTLRPRPADPARDLSPCPARIDPRAARIAELPRRSDMAVRPAGISRLVRTLRQRSTWLFPTAARPTGGWAFLQSGWGRLPALDRGIAYFTSLGIPAPRLQAPLVAAIEFACGGLVLVGIGTRLAALPLIAVMVVALFTALRDQI